MTRFHASLTAVLLLSGALAACTPTPEPSAAPYHSTEVTIRNEAVSIGGTLTRPHHGGPFPAVILVPGGGKQNRDEEFAGHKPFRTLADSLTAAGYAVLRTDDRGVGATTGNKDDATYDDLVSDILVQVSYLREQPEIDRSRIGILGHSQGGSLAPLAAAQAPDRIAFTILFAGPAQTGCEILKHQMRVQRQATGPVSAAQLAAADNAQQLECDLLRNGRFDEARQNAREANRHLPPAQQARPEDIDHAIDQAYAAQATYDPEPALRALRIPVLAVFGSKDVQVDAAANAPLMRSFLAAGPAATVHTVEGANHLLQQATTGMPDEYATIPTTIDPAVLDYVKSWLRETTNR
ncbi:alpha/beta fold hydrolase [Nocardia sp. NPDC048505]|uniref:alpha/beta hydrolase family protein n=1 Tax=unclassified Nocardia TaxID=2637762 RepID=UPI0033EA78F0